MTEARGLDLPAEMSQRGCSKNYDLPVIVSNCSNHYTRYQFPEKLILLGRFELGWELRHANGAVVSGQSGRSGKRRAPGSEAFIIAEIISNASWMANEKL